jgi:hypothetical protein
MAQVVQPLPSKCKALSSYLSNSKGGRGKQKKSTASTFRFPGNDGLIPQVWELQENWKKTGQGPQSSIFVDVGKADSNSVALAKSLSPNFSYILFYYFFIAYVSTLH